MKIALLTDGITPFVTGGMQRHSANLAKYLTLAGVEVTLVNCVAYGDVKPIEDEVNKSLFGDRSEVKLNNIISFHFPKAGKLPGHYIMNSYAYSKSIFERLEEEWQQFDFVYAKGFCGWYFMEQKKKGMKLPPIGVKFHGYEMFQDLPSLSQRLQAKLLRRPTKWNNQNADVVFSYGGKISEIITSQCKVDTKKVWEFTSGIDSDWLRKTDLTLPTKTKKFIFIGRDEKRKGLSELNKVLGELRDQKFEFNFIGPIPEEKRLNDSRFIYHGELRTKEEICEVLDSSDVLVCPSHSEGMPNVILEGMARGLAIIATNVGAVEMLIDDENGLLIDPLNHSQLKNAIIKLIRLEIDELLSMRKVSRNKIENNFLWDKVVMDLLKEIEIRIDEGS